MEDFIVSARKYRPRDFESVVGQENITQTLLKAIENNHLAQAFLFCGPRGVGKTTCARILARTVNAHSMGEAVDANTDYSFNIFELDAASNNSVDDIRNLIDQVRIPPQIGKYKVYIIDEVHMLSTSAFNAFLKTLEEPPSYAIFILATTEKHKVLPTIISRCQVFDFNRIQVSDMVKHLAKIAEQEGIRAENDALHIIAEKADGALRDALSIFDQIVSFAGNQITYKDVVTNLNILDYDYYFEITNAFLNDDKTQALITFNTILNNGFDGHNFVNGLANHFRNLLFCTSPRTSAIMEVGDTVRERYVEQAKACDSRFLLNSLNILSETDINYKSSKNPRLLVELSLLRLCSLASKLNEKKNSTSDLNSGRSEKVLSSKTNTSAPVAEPPQHLAKPSPDEHDTGLKTGEPIDAYSAPREIKEEKTPTAVAEPASKSDVGKVEVVTRKSKLHNANLLGIPSLANIETTKSKSEEGAEPAPLKELVEEIIEENNPVTDFNLEMLWKVWDEYAEEVRKNDRLSYYTALIKHRPVMREAYNIEILVDNHIQKSDIDIDKPNLLGFLRERLNNWQIQLESIIDEDDSNDGDILFDPFKKYEAMVEKNPVLADLKARFNLDVDYDS